MGKDYLLRLGWPPKEANPNFKRRHHWTKYHKQVAAYKLLCKREAQKATRSAEPFSAPLPVEITFYPPDKRHRDDDNIIGQFKSGRDGVAQALGVDDKHWRTTYHFADPVKGGAVLVHIKAGE